MSLRDGAETILIQCLDVGADEKTVVLNDSNDPELVQALLDVLSEFNNDHELLEYPEPEEHGAEPPERIARAMREAEVFVAPTRKSISHTRARVKANEAGARGATLPGITREIWNTSLQADYSKVREISEQVYRALEKADNIYIETPSGTDLEIEIDIDLYETDTGIMHESGEFGNLPAGEADGGAVNAQGVLVVDHIPFVDGAEGTKFHIEGNRVVRIENGGNRLEDRIKSVEGARNVAEFGFGTNPEASLIGNILQDEKVLGTVHIAVGDNSSYVPEGDSRRVECPLHWDMVCKEPTVRFDDKLMLDSGEPVFLD